MKYILVDISQLIPVNYPGYPLSYSKITLLRRIQSCESISSRATRPKVFLEDTYFYMNHQGSAIRNLSV